MSRCLSQVCDIVKQAIALQQKDKLDNIGNVQSEPAHAEDPAERSFWNPDTNWRDETFFTLTCREQAKNRVQGGTHQEWAGPLAGLKDPSGSIPRREPDEGKTLRAQKDM